MSAVLISLLSSIEALLPVGYWPPFSFQFSIFEWCMVYGVWRLVAMALTLLTHVLPLALAILRGALPFFALPSIYP